MEKIVIHGGESLRGEITVEGAKNAVLPLMAATLLTSGVSILRNVPRLRDVDTAIKLLSRLGAKIGWLDDRSLEIDTTSVNKLEAPYDLVRTMRASVLVLGPLVARFGKARVSLPGGCAIGTRSIDLHLKGLSALGAKIELVHGYIHAAAKKLQGTSFFFDISTVGGTENVLMASVMADGTTILENAAFEPEVTELATVLVKMGARIEGIGTNMLVVHGVDTLGPFDHTVMPDRIVAGTYMAAAAITRGDIRIKNCELGNMDAVINKLKEAGVRIEDKGECVRVSCDGDLNPVNVKTQPYPGFPTDMQAQIMALMTLARGTSIITETIFENRFMHVPELVRMGADIKIEGDSAIVDGVEKLSGAPVMASDLRASASLILAGLAAEGTTEVHGIYHLDRGYERMDEKLKSLGARIERLPA